MVLLVAGGACGLLACSAILGIDESSLTEPGDDASVDGARPGTEAGVLADGDATSGPLDSGKDVDAGSADAATTGTVSIAAIGTPTTILPLPALEGDLRFGEALALSPDGNWLAIGAPGAARAGSTSGATGQVEIVQIVRSGSGGALVLGLLDESTVDAGPPAAGGSFGRSLAFSPDGLYLAVGAPQEPHGSGVLGNVYLYELVAGTWGYLRTVAPAVGEATWFGNTVAFNAAFPPPTVNLLFVGATGGAAESGSELGADAGHAAVYVYESGSGRPPVVLMKSASSPQVNDGFGWSIASTPGGGTVVIGAPFANFPSNDGRVYVTSFDSLEASLAPDENVSIGPGSGALFGYSLALTSGNPYAAIIGSPGFEGAGSVIVWGTDGGTNGGTDGGAGATFAPELTAQFPGSGAAPAEQGGRFGASVAADLARVDMSEPLAGNGMCFAGTIADPGKLAPIVTDVDFGPAAAARFGTTLATLYDGGLVAIGAPGGGATPAAVYLTR